MKTKKILVTSLVTAGAVLALASCGEGDSSEDAGKYGYTYNSYSTALGDKWNPHNWETNADNSLLSYLSSPLVDISIKDSKNGVYQWVYEMATSVEDVTATHKDDITKYECTLPEGKTVDEISEGFVYEIKLNENAKWENGEAINADTYVESMKLLLDPTMKNYRANTYLNGDSGAVAGAFDYYYQGENYGYASYKYDHYETSYDSDLIFHWTQDHINDTEMLNTLYVSYGDYWTADMKSIVDFSQAYFNPALTLEDDRYQALEGKTVAEIKANPELNEAFEDVVNFWDEGLDGILALCATTYTKPAVTYDDHVGVYKVDDYTIRYVCQTPVEKNYFLTSLTSNWIVYKPLYEANYDTSGKLKTTKYATSYETTISYGPYKMSSFQAGKQVVFVQNENWYGYTDKDEHGNLVSYTNFKVDGETRRQYQTTKIVIDVMEDKTAKEKFLKGELDDWAPEAADVSNYTTSEQLYKVDETYQMSLFFNTNVEDLQSMDATKGNKNSVVLSNYNFRKAFSLSINRTNWVTATQGYKPGYSILNNLYFYDVFNDPESRYRNTDQAKQAICRLYNVEYGADKVYKTLDEAYNSINGYNLAQAKELMKQAHDELVDAGLYTSGQEIKIRFAYKKGALDSTDNAQLALFQEYLNAAVEGSGFGKVTIEGVGSINDRYKAVSENKEYAVGYGAWGGAAFYPFTNFDVYFDADDYDLQEAACWNPAAETLTLYQNNETKRFVLDNPNDADHYTAITKTYAKWAKAMSGNGDYANASFDVKLDLISIFEYVFLNKYYRIPLASSTSCSMLSYKVSYYTEDYNIMYDFGGFRLISYNYNDAEWADYIAEQGGSLKY